MTDSDHLGRVLAVRLDRSSVTGAYADLSGNRLGLVSRRATWISPGAGPGALAGLVETVLQEMCAAAGIEPAAVAAVCVAVRTDWAGHVEPVRRLLTMLLDRPVTVRVDSYLVALAEARTGRGQGLPDFLMVSDDTLRTVTMVQHGRPMEGAHGLGGALMPSLFRDAGPAPSPRKPWAAAALAIAPSLTAAYLLTGSRTIVLSRGLVTSERRHLISHLESRIRDVAPAARPDIRLSDVVDDAVLLGATVLAMDLMRAAMPGGDTEHRGAPMVTAGPRIASPG